MKPIQNKQNPILKDIEPIWCNGCGLYTIEKALSDSMNSLGWNLSNTVIVSGIGCTGRASGYYFLDGVHTTHGRGIPVAEGIKLANSDLNVVVFSGDGDLLGIGGNHLIHASRRNPNIKVFCNRNEIYGMTGGQLSPTTPINDKTRTTPQGSEYSPIDSKPLITGNDKFYYARTSITDYKHLKDSIEGALKWDGFSFVEILSICPTNHGRDMGFANAGQMTLSLKEKVENDSERYKLEILYKS